MAEAELCLWRRTLEGFIEDNMGHIMPDLKSEDTIVVLPTSTKGSEQLVSQIKAFI